MTYDTLDFIEENIGELVDKDSLPRIPSMEALMKLDLKNLVRKSKNAGLFVLFFASDPYKDDVIKQRENKSALAIINEEEYKKVVKYCKDISVYIPLEEAS